MPVASVSYRLANVFDCPDVAKVHVRSWRESFAGIVPQAFLDKMSVEKRTRAFAERFSTGSYRMYVAEDEAHGIMGFVDFGPARDEVEGYEAELYAIYLLPEFQGRGVGAGLFRLAVRDLIQEGANTMYLLALEVSPYKSFYVKMGGRVMERRQKELEGEMFTVLVYGWNQLNQAPPVTAP